MKRDDATVGYLADLRVEKGPLWSLLVYAAGTGKVLASRPAIDRDAFNAFVFRVLDMGLTALGDEERARFEELLKDADGMIDKAVEDVLMEQAGGAENGDVH